MRWSLVSIALFGGWSVVSVAAERAGWVSIAWDTRWDRVPLELVGLVLWNDLHFFAIHRLLHTRWLFKHVHREHHRALRPTPLSTYAMHPLEAALLGSVMFLVMPFVTLSLATLLLFPMVSLALNNLGHMSYDLVPGRSDWHPLASSRRHALHHSHVTANYGFLLPVLDKLFGTRPVPNRLREAHARGRSTLARTWRCPGRRCRGRRSSRCPCRISGGWCPPGPSWNRWGPSARGTW